MNNYIHYLDLTEEVADTLKSNTPIVALESSIITHGIPYPYNLETTIELLDIIRKNGATPAIIAIIDGRIKIGLDIHEIKFLAQSNKLLKISKRDIPYAIAMKKSGGTTVASTIIFSEIAGINVFATGGIGGVHKGGESSFDVSADLIELANTNIAVVCSGAKSVLDIGLTLEKLETYGVPVLGYKTNEFPSFYTRESGYSVDYKVNSSFEIAKIMKTKWDLDLKGAIIIANPIPSEFELPNIKLNEVIDCAISESIEKNIKGRELTPFLLEKVKILTNGESLKSNIELIKSNTLLACKIATEYIKIN